MENASKALLIAAAVFITILIISLSMYIVRSQNETFNSSKKTMTELEISTFNHKFTLYEGKGKSKSEILSLLKTTINSNATHDNKVAMKFSGLGGSNSVYDSTSYAIVDDETRELIKCNSGNVVSLEELVSKVKSTPTSTYTVTLYYCNNRSQIIGNNKHLNPYYGCVLLIHIEKN